MSDFEKRVSELDKHLNKIEKANEDYAKLEAERNREIEKATREQSTAFSGLIEDLKSTRPETAKIVANFKSAGDDTLKGALLNRKTALAIEAATVASQEGMDALTEEQANALSTIFGDTVEELNVVLPKIAELAADIAETEEDIAITKDSIYAFEQNILATEADLADLTERKKEHKLKVAEQEAMQAELEALMSQEVHEKNKKTHAMQIGALQDKIENILTENNLEQQTIADMTANREELLAEQKDQLEVEKSILNNQEISLQEFTDKKESLMKQETDIREQMNANMEKAKDEQLSGLTDFSEGIKGLTGFDLMGAFDDGVKMFNNLKKVGQGLGKFVQPMIGGLKTVGRSLMTAATSLYAAIAPFLAGAAAFIGGLLVTAGGMLLAAAPYILAGIAIVGLVLAGMKLYEESEKFKAAVDTVIGYFIDIKDSIFKIFGGFFDFWKGLFTGDFDLMFGGLKDMFGGIWDLIKAPFKAIGDFFKNVFGIDIGKFIKDMAKKMLPDWAVDLIFGSGNEAPEMTEEAAEAGKEAAKESGLYEERGLRKSLVNMDMVATAPTNQLEAILNDDDISDESYEAIQRELDNRKSIIAEYEEVTSAIAAGQKTLADGTTADESYVEMLEEEIAMRGGALDQATIDARPQTPTAGGGETVVQQNNNNSSTNIMNDTNSARDENDRYYSELGII